MKLYVAGSWNDREYIKKIMIGLENRGFEITEDWTTHVNSNESTRYAELDVAGVKKADILVLVNSSFISSGKYWECGMAFAWNKQIISIGVRPNTVFQHLISLHVDAEICNTEDVVTKLVANIPGLSALESQQVFMDKLFPAITDYRVLPCGRCKHYLDEPIWICKHCRAMARIQLVSTPDKFEGIERDE